MILAVATGDALVQSTWMQAWMQTLLILSRAPPKQLIKRLSATPVLGAQDDPNRSATPLDSQAALQANKATFFFQLVSPRYLQHTMIHNVFCAEFSEHAADQVWTGTRARESQRLLPAEGGLAQSPFKNTARQEKSSPVTRQCHLPALRQVHHAPGGLPAVRQ